MFNNNIQDILHTLIYVFINFPLEIEIYEYL